ncbi:hypothetical protein AUR04nite_00550 [Glutamicibacter uratoxydans]|uniref:Uncharacterized protein n=1 Tax=Glutamicibacter uratoxydans TaxID=43667 RepID=A0A4Y4DJ02_GLUUR|nr:hypothetical protein [Glutamicibacter uratoxydans]GED04523.1 hypothetical protein AUR04nite_00550 [Glutamicibacter uratoxydans]
MSNVPTFVSGEPGFTVKLNDLGDVVRQLVEDKKALEMLVEVLRTELAQLKSEAPAEKAKAPARSARKTAATS